MSVYASPVARLPRCRFAIPWRPTQRRWARVHDVRFVATQQSQDRITDRYREQLERKAKEKGLGGIDQLKEAYRDEITDLRKKAAVPGVTAPLPPGQIVPGKAPANDEKPQPGSQAGLWASKAAPSSSANPPGVKTLSSFMDVSKAMDLPQREIEALWRLRHANSPQSLAATMPSATYNTIARTARKHPQFILPGLPPDESNTENASETTSPQEAAPIHFLQWTFPTQDTATVLFTHLAEYKLRGEHAQPHTTLTHHLELSGPKGIVLCQGTVVPDRGVNVDEGKWLVMQLQKFYNIGEDTERSETSPIAAGMKQKRRQLVEKFSAGDPSFKVEDLLDEAERLG